MQRSTLWFALGIFSLLSTHAAGQEVQPPTLETIARTGVIRLGYADRNIPFSYLGTGPEPIGYSIELCLKVVDSIREKLDLPGLKVDFVKRTPSNRITLLNDGTIDMRGGSVCLNSFGLFVKWISASIMLPPSLVPAR